MTASPISDLNPIWMACGCVVEVARCGEIGRRRVLIDSKFFTGYRETCVRVDEAIVSIRLPFGKTVSYF